MAILTEEQKTQLKAQAKKQGEIIFDKTVEKVKIEAKYQVGQAVKSSYIVGLFAENLQRYGQFAGMLTSITAATGGAGAIPAVAIFTYQELKNNGDQMVAIAKNISDITMNIYKGLYGNIIGGITAYYVNYYYPSEFAYNAYMADGTYYDGNLQTHKDPNYQNPDKAIFKGWAGLIKERNNFVDSFVDYIMTAANQLEQSGFFWPIIILIIFLLFRK